MACSEQFPMATDETAVADGAGGGTAVEHNRKDPLDARDMDLSGEDHVPKARKPYTITKQREKWTEDEHRRFLEALQLHGRAWRRIQEYIGTKTAVQIRSHAQKFFTKVVRESSSGRSNASAGAAPAIQIPPPRPKRKPARPYPRNVDGAARKPAPELKQLEKPPPPLRMQQGEEGSPTSVLTSALRAEGMGSVFASSSSASRSPDASAAGSDDRGSDGGGGSLASSVDGEDACASPRTRAPYATKVLGDDANEVEAPIFKLFGTKVVVEDLKTDSSSSPASAAAQATRNGNPLGAAGAASSWNPWQPGSVQVQQLMYLVPQPDGFAAQPAVVPWFGYNGGSLPCAVFYPQPQAVSSAQEQQQQASEPLLDHRRAQREGSLTGSNVASSAAAPAAQNSDTAESRRGGHGQENSGDGYAAARRGAAVPRLTKCASSASFSGRGFVPYKRCAAESEARRPVAPGEDAADGELTRLCL